MKHQTPEQRGFTKVKVNRERHNLAVPYRTRTFWKDLVWKNVYYKKEFKNYEEVEIHLRSTFLRKLLVPILAPFFLIYGGLHNYKGIKENLLQIWNPEKCGSGRIDTCSGKVAGILLGLHD